MLYRRPVNYNHNPRSLTDDLKVKRHARRNPIGRESHLLMTEHLTGPENAAQTPKTADARFIGANHKIRFIVFAGDGEFGSEMKVVATDPAARVQQGFFLINLDISRLKLPAEPNFSDVLGHSILNENSSGVRTIRLVVDRSKGRSNEGGTSHIHTAFLLLYSKKIVV